MRLAPQRRAIFQQCFDIRISNVARACQFFSILTYKCASRHSGVRFFEIETSKIAPKLKCFVHFDLQMCFAPQRRAILPHLNFKKWSENAVFCEFWLENVLRATAACHFSTSQLQKVLRTWGFSSIFAWNVLRATAACHFSCLLWPATSARAYFSTQPTHKSLKKHSTWPPISMKQAAMRLNVLDVILDTRCWHTKPVTIATTWKPTDIWSLSLHPGFH